TLVDVASGREIARAECFEFAPLGTMEEIQQRVAAAQKRYDLAVERRQETLSRLRMELSVEQDAAAQDALTEEIAAAEALTTPQFVSRLHAEVLEMHGEARNFTSLLRCACLVHIERRAAAPAAPPGAIAAE
ncbi:MAG: ribbon-helix-helix domain-containing protein, partial [Pseudomonadota bacterium]